VKLFLKNSNLCDHNPPTSQMDGQTTCDRNTALCTKVHRAVIKQSCNKVLKTFSLPVHVLVYQYILVVLHNLYDINTGITDYGHYIMC